MQPCTFHLSPHFKNISGYKPAVYSDLLEIQQLVAEFLNPLKGNLESDAGCSSDIILPVTQCLTAAVISRDRSEVSWFILATALSAASPSPY